MSDKVRWGILACGGIARKFASSIDVVDCAELLAVASASPGKAAAFAKDFGVESSYDSYAGLLADPSIDAVYVANTHNFHHETVLLALEAGKSVLCEKPLAINARQASEMIDLARERSCFLMEGMWTRFLPAVVQARKWIEEGRIGTPKQVYASFGFNMSFDDDHRMVNPDLAGGALLDLGIYPLSFASMVAKGQSPVSSSSVVEKGSTGVDINDSVLLSYPGNLVAHLSFGMQNENQNSAVILGDKGSITLPPMFIAAQSVTLKSDGETLTKDYSIDEKLGFSYEIEAVSQCILDGKTECEIMPLDETLQLAKLMDGFRDEWGVRYKGDL